VERGDADDLCGAGDRARLPSGEVPAVGRQRRILVEEGGFGKGEAGNAVIEDGCVDPESLLVEYDTCGQLRGRGHPGFERLAGAEAACPDQSISGEFHHMDRELDRALVEQVPGVPSKFVANAVDEALGTQEMKRRRPPQ
jgi:hypothetical protein